jgi:hypothetical protein
VVDVILLGLIINKELNVVVGVGESVAGPVIAEGDLRRYCFKA